MTAPLEGVVVADFSRVLAGPYCSMFLADLGAMVLKIERPGVGDDTRAWGPPWTAGSSSYFESVNRAKLSVELNLSDPADLAVARAIATRADVLIENFRTGTMERYGLGYYALRAINPRLVYASITGFGSHEGAQLPGYDFVVQAMGGLMSITGAQDGDPHKVGVALVDVLTGKDATIGILAGLRAREITGLGQHVEVNLLSSLLGSLVNQVSGYLATGRAPGRMGNQHPSIAPYETLRCSDGPLAVACGNDSQFTRMARAVGRPDLATDERFATNSARVEHRKDLAVLLETALAANTAAHWEKVLSSMGVPAGRVADIGGALERATELGLEPTFSVGDGHIPQVTSPISFSDYVPGRRTPPPSLGEHNAVIREWYEPLAYLTPQHDIPTYPYSDDQEGLP